MTFILTAQGFILGYLYVIYYGLYGIVLILVNYLKNPFRNPWAQKLRLVPPAPLSDPKYGVHKYAKVNDIKLHYVESGDPSKQLIVFVHGFPEFWYSWRHQILEFQKKYWVVAVDMRGYGDSEKPEGVSDYDIDLLSADIRELIRYLGREKCILISHDWGCLVAAAVRDKYPEVLDAVITTAAASLSAMNNMIVTDPDQKKKSWYTFFFRLPWFGELLFTMDDLQLLNNLMSQNIQKGAITNDDLECYKYWFGKPGGMTPPLNYYRALGFRGFGMIHMEKPTSEKNIPFLALFVEKDIAISPKTSELMKREYKHIETIVVPDISHFLQEEDPEKVNNYIKNFLLKHNL